MTPSAATNSARSAALALMTLLPSSGLAQTADKFDLDCKGVQRDLMSGERRDVAIRVHIDLAAQRFCFDACDGYQHVYPIADPAAATIEYDFDVYRKGPDHPAGIYRGGDPDYFWPKLEHIVIRRDALTLQHDYLYAAGEPASQTFHFKSAATCTRAPFGGNLEDPARLSRRLEDDVAAPR